MSNSIEAKYQAAIDAGEINGAVLCATDAKGDFVYRNALGQRTLLSGEKKPQQLDDMIFLASASKLITTVAVLQCVEDGLLTLTSDLSTIVPELTEKQVLTGFSDDDQPILAPTVRPITLEMLLTHSAGASYHFLDPPIKKWSNKFVKREPGQRYKVEDFFVYPLGHQPGAGWMYGTGTDWAGRILERLTGQTLGEHVVKRILAPFGSKDAQFVTATREDLRSRLVNLNPDDPQCLGKAVIGGEGEMNSASQGDFGGHGLFMTGTDFLKVLQSILANDGKLLRPATVDEMFRNHLAPEADAGFQAALRGPAGQFFRVGIDSATKIGFGLGGVLTLEDSEGWYGSHTLTWGGGQTLAFFIDRKNDLCGVGAVQATYPVNIPVANDLKQVFRKNVYRKQEAWKQQQQS